MSTRPEERQFAEEMQKTLGAPVNTPGPGDGASRQIGRPRARLPRTRAT